MLKVEDLRGKTHVVLCTPCYGGQVFQNYFLSVIKLLIATQKHGVRLSFIIRGGDSLIPRTRNSIVAEFLTIEDATHLFWVDADIGFDASSVFRLLCADRDVVAGIYPLKKINFPPVIPKDMTRQEFDAHYARYPFNPISKTFKIDTDGFVEVLDAPTGFMMIKRGVFTKMIEKYPDLKITADIMPGLEHIKDKIKDLEYRFFDVMTEENGRYLSEDYAYCRRWQKIGGKIYADVASNLTHQGGHVFTGNFAESLKLNIIPAAAPNTNSIVADVPPSPGSP